MNEVTYSDVAGLKLMLPHVIFLKMIGIFPHNQKNKIMRFLTTSFGIVLFVAALVHGIMTMIILPHIFKSQNFFKLATGINFLAVTVSCLHKYYLLMFKHKIFQKLGEWAANIKMNHQQSIEQHFIVKVVKLANFSFYFCCFSAAANWTLWPFFSKSSGPIIPSGLPGSWDTALIFIQGALVLYFASVISFTALSVCNMMGTLCTEVFYVSQRLQQLKYDLNNPSDFNKNLILCIEEHVEAYRILKDVREILSGMFLYQVFITISIACAFIFGLLKKGAGYNIVLTILPIAFASIPEFALVCWLGEQITDEFLNIHWSIYNNNWFEAPSKVQLQLRATLEISKSPVYLLGGKVFRASLSTFVEAMKQAFSLYTLLKALTGED